MIPAARNPWAVSRTDESKLLRRVRSVLMLFLAIANCSCESSGYDATVDPVVIMVSHQNSTMLDRLGFLHVRGEALQALRPAHFHSGQILRGRWCYGQNLCVQR